MTNGGFILDKKADRPLREREVDSTSQLWDELLDRREGDEFHVGDGDFQETFVVVEIVSNTTLAVARNI